MHRRNKKNLLWLLLLVTLVVAVGSAFTAANTFDPAVGDTLGFGTQNVTGATVTYMDYTLSANGILVDTVTFKATGDLTGGNPAAVGYVGFDYGGGPTTTANVTCAAGTFAAGDTTYVCDMTSLLDAERTVATIVATNIAVAD